MSRTPKSIGELIEEKEQELKNLLQNFPDKRNDPAGAVDALNRSRLLSQEIRSLVENRTGSNALP